MWVSSKNLLYRKLCPVSLRKSGIFSASSEGTKPVLFKDQIYFLKDAKTIQVCFIFPD